MAKEYVNKKNVLTYIFNESKKIFKDYSVNYRQKLVYKLLSAVKENNQREFFNILFRSINAILNNSSDTNVFLNKIGELYPFNPIEFETLAYSIILGIMTAGGDIE